MGRRLTKNEKKRLKRKDAKENGVVMRKEATVEFKDLQPKVERQREGSEDIEVVVQGLDLTLDMASLQQDYQKVMQTFFGENARGGGISGGVATEEGGQVREGHIHDVKLFNAVGLECKDEGGPSKRKEKAVRMTVPELKRLSRHPALVDAHDVNAKDPLFLVELKATRNSVSVPRHWNAIRKYLMGKVGHERAPFQLPSFISDTGIAKVRDAILEAENDKGAHQRAKERTKVKMGRVDLDYQVLHDAFFKYQEKPRLSMHGNLYYEGKEFEVRGEDKGFKPGVLSTKLRLALDLPEKGEAPPPWLTNMQRYGPPPGHPGLKVPGLNCPIPAGQSFGYFPGCWGKPPVDADGQPLYGPVFGKKSYSTSADEGETVVDLTLWGGSDSNVGRGDSATADKDEDEAFVDDIVLGEDVILARNEAETTGSESGDKTSTEQQIGQDLLAGTASVQALEETVIDLRKRKGGTQASTDSSPKVTGVVETEVGRGRAPEKDTAPPSNAAGEPAQKPAKRQRKGTNFKF